MRRRTRRLRRLGSALAVTAAVVLGAVAARRPPAAPAPGDAQVATRLQAHLAFLADDLLDGRATGSPQYEIAARYVASQFQQLGLQPVGPAGGYLLPVSLLAADLDADSGHLEIVTAAGRQPLAWGADFIAGGDLAHESSEVEAPVVFVGHGVSAAASGWDDYAGVDVRGKVVLLVSGAPERLPHDERAYYGSLSEKRREAVRHGAIGVLTYRAGVDAAGSWERLARNAGRRPAMTWIEAGGTPHDVDPRLRAVASLSPKGLETLLHAAGKELDAVGAASAAPGKGFELGVSIHLALSSHHRRLTSSNVAGLLPGRDPRLGGETVVVSAHLDHLGEGAPKGGDSIYNGYYDNAMGSALMLETARALASARERPRRAVLFVAVTGEERGLLGSGALADAPPPAAGHLVADVNLDMPLFLYPVADLVAFGAEHSSMGAAVERATHAAGFALSPDPMPDESIFVRSDQYSFVRRGLPAIYLIPGFRSLDPKVKGEAVYRAFLAEHYHQPSDDASLPVDWPSAARFLAANAILVRDVADAETAPSWNRGDFFARHFAGAPGPAVAPRGGDRGRRRLQD